MLENWQIINASLQSTHQRFMILMLRIIWLNFSFFYSADWHSTLHMSISTAHTLQCSLHLWTWTLWGMVCKSVSPNSSSHWCFFVWKNLLVHVPLKILIKTKNVSSIENKAFERTLDFRILKMFKFFCLMN